MYIWSFMTATNQNIGLYHFKVRYWDDKNDEVYDTSGIVAAPSYAGAAQMIEHTYNVFRIDELYETFILLDEEDIDYTFDNLKLEKS